MPVPVNTAQVDNAASSVAAQLSAAAARASDPRLPPPVDSTPSMPMPEMPQMPQMPQAPPPQPSYNTKEDGYVHFTETIDRRIYYHNLLASFSIVTRSSLKSRLHIARLARRTENISPPIMALISMY